MALGEQRARDQANFYIQQMTQQRMLEELKLRAQQAQQTQQYQSNEQQLGQSRLAEERHNHNNMMNEFAIKYHQTKMKNDLAAKGQWKPFPEAGILYNTVTGETKPLAPGQGGRGSVGVGAGRTQQADAAELGHILQAIPQVESMGTNAPPTVMPGLTNMLNSVQGRIMGQGGGMPQGPQLGQPPGMQAPQGMPTNMPPQQPRFRFDPNTGQLTPAQ